MTGTTTGTTPNNFLYAGEQFDSSLGLYYLRARYYNPATGRCLAMDPDGGNLLNPSTWHTYTFAQNDPASKMDLEGTFEGLVEVDFYQIVYRAHPLPGTGCINVSTFSPPFSK